MAYNQVNYDVNKYINGDKEALAHIQVKLEHENRELRAANAADTVYLLKTILSSKYTYSLKQIQRGLCLIRQILTVDNFVLLDLIKSELEPILLDLRSFSKSMSFDFETQPKIRQEATEICDILNSTTPTEPIMTIIKEEAEQMPTINNASSSSSAGVKKCKKCKNTEVIMLSCKTKQCRNCFKAFVIDNLYKEFTLVQCPCRNHGLEIPTFISVLDLKTARAFLKRQSSSERKFTLVECTKCRGPAVTDEQTMFLGQCGNCNDYSCTLCQGPYHGFSDCPIKAKKDFPEDFIETGVDKQRSSGSLTETKSQGAEALNYELEFYKEQESFANKSVEIDKAFEPEISGTKQEFTFPWENMPQPSHSRSDYTGEYSCLDRGKWLDDVVIERAIQAIIDNPRVQPYVTLFESYVYSYFINHPPEDFYRLIAEKSPGSKRYILSLMNTEAQSVGGHWILGIADQRSRTIFIMDTSMVLSPRFYRKFFYFLLNVIHLSRNGEDFNPNEWKLQIRLDTIQQQNSFDCGALVIANFYAYTHSRILIDQPDSAELRKWIYDLVKNSDDKDAKVVENCTENPLITKRFDDIPKFNPKGLKYIYST